MSSASSRLFALDSYQKQIYGLEWSRRELVFKKSQADACANKRFRQINIELKFGTDRAQQGKGALDYIIGIPTKRKPNYE